MVQKISSLVKWHKASRSKQGKRGDISDLNNIGTECISFLNDRAKLKEIKFRSMIRF